MDVHAVSITPRDLERIKAEVSPAEPAGVVGDFCNIYIDGRHWILAAIAVLQFLLPQAASVLLAVVAGLDAACKGQSEEGSSLSRS
jgi:hypothetical protein